MFPIHVAMGFSWFGLKSEIVKWWDTSLVPGYSGLTVCILDILPTIPVLAAHVESDQKKESCQGFKHC